MTDVNLFDSDGNEMIEIQVDRTLDLLTTKKDYARGILVQISVYQNRLIFWI